MGRTSLGISQRRPSISRLAAVAAELGRMTSATVTRMGPPAEPQGMALGDCVWGAGDSGEKAAKPHTANGRQCVHRPSGRWTARDHAGARWCGMMHRLGERRRHPGAGIRSRRRSEVCLPGADSTPMGLACGAGVRPEPGNRLHSGPIRTRRTPRAWPWETMWGALATPGEKAAKPHTVPPKD